MLTAYGLTNGDLSALHDDLKLSQSDTELSANERSAASTAQVRLRLLRQQMYAFRRSYREALRQQSEARDLSQPDLTELGRQVADLTATNEQIEDYIESLLSSSLGGTGVGSLLPEAELKDLISYSAAVRRLSESLASPSTRAQEDFYDAVVNPPKYASPAASVLQGIASSSSTTVLDLASSLGVTPDVLEGVLDDAQLDASVGDLIADLTDYYRSEPFASQRRASGDVSLSGLLGPTSRNMTTVSLPMAKALTSG